jgi:membrane associated rhomboid family serine protease
MVHFTDNWHIEGGVEERFAAPCPARFLPYLAALSSARIPHRVEEGPDGGRWIVVPEGWGDAARAELVVYEQANRGWPHQGRIEAVLGSLSLGETLCAMGVAAALVNVYLRTGPVEHSDRLFALGSLDVARVCDGEWWRAVTSLWLHADGGHLLGNAVAAFAFGTALTQLVGVGPAWALVLLSGVFGNLSEAWLVGGGRTAIGASTATFGALGALGMLQTVRAWQRWGAVGAVFSRTWVPLGAAAALLGWLGAGPDSDVIGHALGFAWGMILGVPCLGLLSRPLPWYVHALCGLLCSGLVAWAWHLAGA